MNKLDLFVGIIIICIVVSILCLVMCSSETDAPAQARIQEHKLCTD